jgi:DNA-binding phage protein
MLLIEMPSSASSSSPPPTPFDQILRKRMAELGLGEAELVDRYIAHRQADRNSKRSIPVKAVRGESDPTLATVLDLLHEKVLDGKLAVQWGNDEEYVLPDPGALSSVLRNRMVDFGLDPAAPRDLIEVTRRYLVIRYGEQDRNPWGSLNTVKQVIGDSPNPRLQTLIQVVQALGGQVLVRWQVTVRKQLPAEELPESLREKPTTPVFLEYQEWSIPQPLSTK